MPEVILPCPACGSTDCECLVCTINADESQTIHFHMACNKCFTSGPIADDAESAKKLWDSIPRSLAWTDEPPKVEGFYFLKMASGTISMVYLSEQDIKDKDWHGCAGQWVVIAGPIPAPLD